MDYIWLKNLRNRDRRYALEVLIATATTNLFSLILMRIVQDWEARTRRISPRRPHNPGNPAESFLYQQDFYTTLWGDYIGLSATDLGVIWLIQEHVPSMFVIVGCPLVALAVTIWCHLTWMGPTHKPDAGYPAPGTVSFTGRIHILYFFVQFTLALIGVWMVGTIVVAARPWSVAAGIGLAGGSLYVLMWVLDVKTGRFASLPRK